MTIRHHRRLHCRLLVVIAAKCVAELRLLRSDAIAEAAGRYPSTSQLVRTRLVSCRKGLRCSRLLGPERYIMWDEACALLSRAEIAAIAGVDVS